MGLTGGFARASAAGWRSLQAMPIAPACAVVVAPCAPSAPCWPCAAPGGSCAARRRGAGANRRIQMRTASNVCLKQQATTLVISCIYRGLYLPSLMWMWLVFVCGFPFSSKRWGGFFIFLELWRKDFFFLNVFHLNCFSLSEDLRWIAASKIWVPAGLTSEAGNEKSERLQLSSWGGIKGQCGQCYT